MGKRLTLILGGARSGKSQYALRLAVESGLPVLFVATATAGDEEMIERIAAHKAGRPAAWLTLEAPLGVGRAIEDRRPSGMVLLDCLTLLASNVLLGLKEPADRTAYEAAMQAEIEGLLRAYHRSDAEWLVISNEVGLGIVPEYPSGRLYRDVLGLANQRLAQAADRVVFMAAGLSLMLKE